MQDVEGGRVTLEHGEEGIECEGVEADCLLVVARGILLGSRLHQPQALLQQPRAVCHLVVVVD